MYSAHVDTIRIFSYNQPLMNTYLYFTALKKNYLMKAYIISYTVLLSVTSK